MRKLYLDNGVIILDFSVTLPLQKTAHIRDLAPSVHWAQFHRLKTGGYKIRRIYDFELLYLIEGSGVAQYADRHYRLTAGDLLILPAGVPHKVDVTEKEGAAFIGIHFDFFDELEIKADEDIIVNEQSVQPELFCQEPVLQPFQPLSSQPVRIPPQAVVPLMEQVTQEFTRRAPGYELACRSLLLLILTLLWRDQSDAKRTIHPKYGDIMLQLASKIEAAPGEDWSGHRLAALTNLQEDYVSKLFKAAVGLPPNKYIQSVRHREAKRLLRETDATVETVGLSLGYRDLHYFSRIFHKWEGISPREYRNLSRIL